MFKVYIYALDTLADWELGYVTAELNSGRFFKKDAPEVSVKTVAVSREPIKTMGGADYCSRLLHQRHCGERKECVAVTRSKHMGQSKAQYHY